MDRLQCSKSVSQRGGACLAATRRCALRVVFTDHLGRGWCDRHRPDRDTLARWAALAAVRQ